MLGNICFAASMQHTALSCRYGLRGVDASGKRRKKGEKIRQRVVGGRDCRNCHRSKIYSKALL